MVSPYLPNLTRHDVATSHPIDDLAGGSPNVVRECFQFVAFKIIAGGLDPVDEERGDDMMSKRLLRSKSYTPDYDVVHFALHKWPLRETPSRPKHSLPLVVDRVSPSTRGVVIQLAVAKCSVDRIVFP